MNEQVWDCTPLIGLSMPSGHSFRLCYYREPFSYIKTHTHTIIQILGYRSLQFCLAVDCLQHQTNSSKKSHASIRHLLQEQKWCGGDVSFVILQTVSVTDIKKWTSFLLCAAKNIPSIINVRVFLFRVRSSFPWRRLYDQFWTLQNSSKNRLRVLRGVGTGNSDMKIWSNPLK